MCDELVYVGDQPADGQAHLDQQQELVYYVPVATVYVGHMYHKKSDQLWMNIWSNIIA